MSIQACRCARPNRAKTAATLLVLIALAPLNLAVVLACFCASSLAAMFAHKPSNVFGTAARTVLISGGKMTKALQLARSFHAAGHRVVLIETHKYWFTGHRFSRAVAQFRTVPDPRDPGYAEALLKIVQSEDVDIYIPVCSPVASVFDSLAIPLLRPFCEVVHLAPEAIGEVDDKFRFAELAAVLGLRTPKSFRITDPRDVEAFDFSQETRSFILKSIAYDSVRRLDLTPLPRPTLDETRAFVRALPISPANPWVMQEFIAGREYCTHGTVRDGALRVHCCCESSPFQINYEQVEKPDIERWVQRFAAGLGATGQVSLDFIEADDDGEIYAIECNPRTHSAITMLYDRPDLAAAYLGDPVATLPLRPSASSRPTYWLYHEIWRLIVAVWQRAGVRARLGTIMRGKDAVFDWRDPLPFLMLHHFHVPLLLLGELKEGRGWLRIDFNIGKLVQPGGD